MLRWQGNCSACVDEGGYCGSGWLGRAFTGLWQIAPAEANARWMPVHSVCNANGLTFNCCGQGVIKDLAFSSACPPLLMMREKESGLSSSVTMETGWAFLYCLWTVEMNHISHLHRVCTVYWNTFTYPITLICSQHAFMSRMSQQSVFRCPWCRGWAKQYDVC